MKKAIIPILVLIAIILLIAFFISKNPNYFKTGSSNVEVQAPVTNEQKEKQYDRAKEIISPAGYINTDSITINELIGKKVILVDFWTYSCINCQRTLPYLTAWYEKYRDQGLEIIGIHSPEFEFEKEYDNVVAATKKWGIEYPVVLDNEFATWNNYGNRYWPRKYLIDIDGYIVYDHIGEGAYDTTEKKIQELLKERMTVLGESGNITESISRPENTESVVPGMKLTPEIYFGASRNSKYLGNGNAGSQGVQTFDEPKSIKDNLVYLEGEWDIQDEYAESRGSGRIILKYQAQKVFMVLSAENEITAQVLIDGNPVSQMAGQSVQQSSLPVQAEQLYRIIEDNEWGEHTLQIIIPESGLRAYTFTFG